MPLRPRSSVVIQGTCRVSEDAVTAPISSSVYRRLAALLQQGDGVAQCGNEPLMFALQVRYALCQDSNVGVSLPGCPGGTEH